MEKAVTILIIIEFEVETVIMAAITNKYVANILTLVVRSSTFTIKITLIISFIVAEVGSVNTEQEQVDFKLPFVVVSVVAIVIRKLDFY